LFVSMLYISAHFTAITVPNCYIFSWSM